MVKRKIEVMKNECKGSEKGWQRSEAEVVFGGDKTEDKGKEEKYGNWRQNEE